MLLLALVVTRIIWSVLGILCILHNNLILIGYSLPFQYFQIELSNRIPDCQRAFAWYIVCSSCELGISSSLAVGDTRTRWIVNTFASGCLRSLPFEGGMNDATAMATACPYATKITVNDGDSCNGFGRSIGTRGTNLKDETLTKLTHMAWMRQPSESRYLSLSYFNFVFSYYPRLSIGWIYTLSWRWYFSFVVVVLRPLSRLPW